MTTTYKLRLTKDNKGTERVLVLQPATVVPVDAIAAQVSLGNEDNLNYAGVIFLMHLIGRDTADDRLEDTSQFDGLTFSLGKAEFPWEG